MWFIGVEVEQETSAPPPKKNPGSAPEGAVVSLSSENVVFIIKRKLSLITASRRVFAKADNTLRDLHNSSYDTIAAFNNCFIVHSK